MESYRASTMDFVVFTLVLTFCFINPIDAGNKKSFCNVCRAVVEEANWRISQSDPKRMIQVGSFRVDPQGNQNIKEKTYARSESHVEEIFESICNDVESYGEMNQDDGSMTVVRTRGHHGEDLQTKDHNVDMASGKRLRYQCHDFLESHEEDVMALLQREDIDNYEQVICGAETSVCSEKELSTPLIQLPELEVEDDPEDETDDEDDENEDEEDEDDENEDEDTEEGDSIASEFEKTIDIDAKDEL